MPQIPTNDKPVLIQGRGSMQPFATEDAFGASRAEAISRFGASAREATIAVGSIFERRAELTATQWSNDSMSNARKHFSEWLADPQNQNEDYADNFVDQAKKFSEQYESAAPSEYAKQMFRAQFQDYVDSRYESATKTAATIGVQKVIESFTGGIDSMMAEYQHNRNVPNLDAGAKLLQDIPTRLDLISAVIGETAPEHARLLSEKLLEDGAYATMGHSPDLARRILDLAPMDAQRKATILKQIETAEESLADVDKYAGEKMVADYKAQVKNSLAGKEQGKLDLRLIQSYYPGKRGEDIKSALDDWHDATVEAKGTLADISQFNMSAQATVVDRLHDEATTAHKELVWKLVEEGVNENYRQYTRDPAQYAMNNVPSIRTINDQLRTASESERPALYAQRDALMRMFQSPGAERDRHHVVDRDQVKVVSDAEAESRVASINQSSPKEAFDLLRGYLSEHPGHEDVAFNNLVTLRNGPGLRGDYWLVYQNIDNPEVQTLIGALQSFKSIRETANEELVDKYKKYLTAYPPFRAAVQAMSKDGAFQLTGIAEGFMDGLITIAMGLGGKSPEKDVQRSFDRWVEGPMHVASMDGVPVLMNRTHKVGDHVEKYSNEEIDDIMRRLLILPRMLNTSEIKLTDEYGHNHFPKIDTLGTDEAKEQYVRDMVVSRGRFIPDSTGKFAVLKLQDDYGFWFEVRDKQNRAYQIKIDDVPQFTEDVQQYYGRSGYMGAGQAGLGVPRKRVADEFSTQIVERDVKFKWPVGDDMIAPYGEVGGLPLPFFIPRTNWPVRPREIEMVPR